ncbi:MAG: GDP-mannose 4,6-dehydratase [Phycisphaeraceae bacterium]|nr:GDP-mannose 4,6-dehydratase [Phycisphaeraceae bacterium]
MPPPPPPSTSQPASQPGPPAKVALITGITGQDGSYLTELLLSKNYTVHGIVRRASNFNTQRLDHLYVDPHDASAPGRMILHYGDVTDSAVLERLVRHIDPHEVYHLAAQSHVRVSFELPVHTVDSVALGTFRILEALRSHAESRAGAHKRVRFYQASSSEMFGASPPPQSETTPFRPRSPYAIAKLAAHYAAINYREAYGMHCSCGIHFNHESPRRGETFVTRKITRAVGRIKAGLQRTLFLGNLDARRDWGFAGDYARAMWLMLQRDTPDDYVIATGRTASVRDFCEMAFARAGLDYRDFVQVDPRYFRPAEVDELRGDASKARRELDWHPTVSLEQLVDMMVDADIARAEKELAVRAMSDGRTP